MVKTHNFIHPCFLIFLLCFSAPVFTQEASNSADLQILANTSTDQNALTCDLTPEYLLENHAEAIRAGQEIYLRYWQANDPDGDYSDYSQVERIETWNEIILAYFSGNDDGGMEYLALYTPEFADYLLTDYIYQEFSLSDELAKERGIVLGREIIAEGREIIAEENARQAEGREIIAEENARQAEGREIIAEENAKQEALRRLIETLSLHSK